MPNVPCGLALGSPRPFSRAVGRLDFSTLEPLPTERIDPDLRRRSNDLIWRVRFRDAADGPEWLRVLLMLEFQSSVDWGMPLRVQSYAVRLFESLWQALADLVGKGTQPQAAAKASRPQFVGERYELVDIGAYKLEGLPEGNLVSLVVAAERMTGPGEATAVLERALRLLSAAEREKLRVTFLNWFRLLVARTGVDLDVLEDPEMLERIEERGLARGLERERQLLVRLVGRKFGREVADLVAGPLAGISDPDRVQEVGDWIIDCATGGDLLARLRGIG